MIPELLSLYENIHRVKHNQRQGWLKQGYGVDGVVDTQASHMFGASIVAWWYAEKSGLDSGKLTKMLLIHDLMMARMPDHMPEHADYARKREIENEVLEQVILSFPSEIRDEVAALLREYQEEKTPYAIGGRECDKLETLLQAYQYARTSPVNNLKEFFESYEKKFVTTIGKQLFAEFYALALST